MVVSGRVGAKGEAVLFRFFSQIIENDSRLYGYQLFLRVEGKDAVVIF